VNRWNILTIINDNDGDHDDDDVDDDDDIDVYSLFNGVVTV